MLPPEVPMVLHAATIAAYHLSPIAGSSKNTVPSSSDPLSTCHL